ncbi:unnamed protein product [Nyctereutes procyonoides]|uniref:(raccoon dog) hypothetical protein n=1 Tax=Nyctereutes procyonoides TaxID=34880 RepID=A0A811YKL1_NYCPR|nr:unnamed protein product [Nyctereutes procyonoides]
MVYISNGQVLDSRSQSPWRLSLITDFFWRIAEFVRRGYGNSSDSRYDDGIYLDILFKSKKMPKGTDKQRSSYANHV